MYVPAGNLQSTTILRFCDSLEGFNFKTERGNGKGNFDGQLRAESDLTKDKASC